MGVLIKWFKLYSLVEGYWALWVTVDDINTASPIIRNRV